MDTTNFCYWLHGLFELNKDIKTLNEEQTLLIKQHLELVFKNSRGTQIKAIAFFKTKESFNNTLFVGERINLIATFEKNTFGGRTELRIRIVDITP